jgi:hypothetical protein
MTEMDYFAQKPEMDMKSFFEGKGLRMAATDPVPVPCAPPPKDSVWVAPSESTTEAN